MKAVQSVFWRVLVVGLHHDAEQVHHGVEAEDQDDGAQVPEPDEHADEHDHQRGAEGVFVEADRVHALLQVLHVAPVADGGQVEVRHGRDEQEAATAGPKRRSRKSSGSA